MADQAERVRQKIAAQQERAVENLTAARNRAHDRPVEAGRFTEQVLVRGLFQARDRLAPKLVEMAGYKIKGVGKYLMEGHFNVFDPATGRLVPPELALTFTINPSRENSDVLWLRTTNRVGDTRPVPVESLTGPLGDFTVESIADLVVEAWLA